MFRIRFPPPPFPPFTTETPCPEERLGQLTFLVQTFGAHAVSPRFDPIVHYRNIVGGSLEDPEIWKKMWMIMNDHLGGGFKHFYFHPYLGKMNPF